MGGQCRYYSHTDKALKTLGKMLIIEEAAHLFGATRLVDYVVPQEFVNF